MDWIEIGHMDELGRMDTPLHRMDARAKAIVTGFFIAMVVSFPRYEIAALTPFLLYPVALVAGGRIPPRHIVRKIVVAAPFALFIGIFNPILDRQPVMTVGSIDITGGWISFVSIMLRFLLTVGAGLALIACTGMNRLASGLGRLGVPRVFVVQMLFLYRYLFVVSEEGAKMIRSVQLRSAGARTLSLRVYGSLVGHLLLRTLDRAERVYRAMVARGFDGEIRVLRGSTWGVAEWCFVVGWMLFFCLARRWNLAGALGSFITRIVS